MTPLLVVVVLAQAQQPTAITAEQLQFFESRIRPILVDRCYGCHSAQSGRSRGGYLLDTRDGIRKGGSSGVAIVPGKPDESLFIEAIRYQNEDLEMPPKGQIPADELKDLERWVAMGAPDPREALTAKPKTAEAPADVPAGELTAADIQKGRAWWSYSQPVRHAAPSVNDTAWPSDDVDRFVLAAMESKGLEPVKDAAAIDLVRRVTFDLTGLPPAPADVAAFLRDKAPGAYERLVDRLLASRAFAEHWGRHWLDVARYAESSGREGNTIYPYAWRYRDWVIDAFDRNLPYDEFLRHQLAGDLLPSDGANDAAAKSIATGFLAIGSKAQRTRSKEQFSMDLADEQIDAFSQAMLGTTIACARCHDHKFDPITQRDYYALAGIFLSTETYYGTSRSQGNFQPSQLIELPTNADLPNGPTLTAYQKAAYERMRELAEQNADRQQGNQKVLAQQAVKGFDAMLARFDEDGRANSKNRLAMGVRERVEDVDARILARGEIDKAGESVPRGFPEVLTDPSTGAIGLGSGRLQLANWVSSPSNPLTARVFVNRAWEWLFGSGIVPTPDNFGTSGVAPTHPELLDRLACDFVASGWDVKSLVRRLVLTHTYRLASSVDAGNAKSDPDVTWLWRARDRRLPAEAIRDAMLMCAGAIDAPPIGSLMGSFEGGFGQRGDQLGQVLLRDIDARSIYLPVVRDFQNEALDAFDFADPSFVTGDRDETTVATQALFLMNDERVLELAMRMARRLMRMEDAKDDDRITFAFQLALGRTPSATERRWVTGFLRDFHAADDGPPGGTTSVRDRIRRRVQAQAGGGLSPDMLNASREERAWAAFCQALFQTAEFRYLD